jgi:hypothetical protein
MPLDHPVGPTDDGFNKILSTPDEAEITSVTDITPSLNMYSRLGVSGGGCLIVVADARGPRVSAHTVQSCNWTSFLQPYAAQGHESIRSLAFLVLAEIPRGTGIRQGCRGNHERRTLHGVHAMIPPAPPTLCVYRESQGPSHEGNKEQRSGRDVVSRGQTLQQLGARMVQPPSSAPDPASSNRLP